MLPNVVSSNSHVGDSGTDPILQRCKAGEDSAWDDLHQKYRPFVHSIILASGQSIEDAEELGQEVFLRVFRHIQELRDLASFSSWLRTTTTNMIVDRARSAHRRPKIMALHDEDAVSKNSGHEALSQQVLSRIQSLTPAYREPLILRLVEGLSGVEIAHITGLTHESVRVNLYRGMARLRELLKKDGLP